MGKVAAEPADRLGHAGDVRSHGAELVSCQVDLALGFLQQAQRVGLIAQLLPGDVLAGGRDQRLRLGAEGRQGDPVEQVQPELQVVELAQHVVAEQVGVGGHDHPARAVPQSDEQRRARGMRRGAGAQHDRAVVARA